MKKTKTPAKGAAKGGAMPMKGMPPKGMPMKGGMMPKKGGKGC